MGRWEVLLDPPRKGCVTSGEPCRRALPSAQTSAKQEVWAEMGWEFSFYSTPEQAISHHPLHDGMRSSSTGFLLRISGVLCFSISLFPESVLFSGFDGGGDVLRCGEFHTLDSFLLGLLPHGSKVKEESSPLASNSAYISSSSLGSQK